MTFAGLQMLISSMFDLDGCSSERQDLAPEEFVVRQHRWRERADELPANVKTVILVAEIMRRRHGYAYVARSLNRLRSLRPAYDAALSEVDVLVMPTTPMKAPLLPPADASPDVVVAAASAPLANTSAFNSTHHPALSIPCGSSDGLPVGMMLVGRHFDEMSLYRLAHAFEQQTA